jgi:integrase/recombinase XerD
LKAVIAFSNHLGPGMSFYNIEKREQITGFLDTKRKGNELDPDKKWITTWNHYLIHIKLFLRWLYNCRGKAEEKIAPQSEWETPDITRIKELKTKRLSPYSETEIWDRDDLLEIVKYEPYLRNKAALTLFWDLDARNHEVTALKIQNIRLGERYGEGEIPHNTKTGGGPFMLACSFPYVRDWLNKHPFKNSPEVNLICNLHNGAPVKPEAMWSMMKQLRMLDNGSIKDVKERRKLEQIISTKKMESVLFASLGHNIGLRLPSRICS